MDALVGYIVALTLSMMGVASFVTWAKLGVANVQTAATASQMLVFDKAAQQYVQDNAVQLVSITNSAAAYPVPAAALAPYLPKGFATTNPFGQTWQLQVIQVAGGQLQSLVTSQNGRPIADTKQLAQIAAQAGAQGGFVPYAGQGGDAAMNPASAQGAYGGWSVPLAKFANPGSGHLASLLTFTNAQANNDYLYRVAVPGQATLNQMQTALDMNTNDIKAANDVAASSVSVGGASLSYNGAAQQLYVNAPGGTVLKDPAGAFQPLYSGAISASGTLNATGAVTSTSPAGGAYGTQTSLTQSGLNGNGDIFIQPKGGSTLYLDASGFNGSGQMYSDFATNTFHGQLVANQYIEVDGGATEGTSCGSRMLIANSGSGPLFCQNGLWVALNSSGSYVSNLGATGSTGWVANNSSKTQWVIATGGNGGNNSCDLQANIAGVGLIAYQTDNNVDYAKTCFISFPVPAGKLWIVTSNPWSSPPGGIGVWVYQ